MYESKDPDSHGLVDYTSIENETWSILYKRQERVIQNRACDEFIRGLEILDMPKTRIPQCTEISDRLQRTTGWSVEPVSKIIPLQIFFELLANKKFPAATFIRTREDLDYLPEPDIFHEFFGHCPLLTNQAYADFIEAYGQLALKSTKETRSILGRLFWFSIEFGLIKSTQGLRIYGGGILSSFEETRYALESQAPERVPFHIREVMKTSYRYDEIQHKYFILESLDDLFKITQLDLLNLASKIAGNIDQAEDFILC